jgi:hypothetical protein
VIEQVVGSHPGPFKYMSYYISSYPFVSFRKFHTMGGKNEDGRGQQCQANINECMYSEFDYDFHII